MSSIARSVIRNNFRMEAEAHKYKASKWVHNAYDLYAGEKYGKDVRAENIAKGTHKKHLWKSRCGKDKV